MGSKQAEQGAMRRRLVAIDVRRSIGLAKTATKPPEIDLDPLLHASADDILQAVQVPV